MADPLPASLLPVATNPDDDDFQIVIVDGVTSRMANSILRTYFQAGLTGSILGNTVTAPNDTTVPWKVVSFDNTPAVNMQEWRQPNNTLHGAVGPEWIAGAVSLGIFANVFPFKLIDNGTTTTPPVGIQNGQAYFYYTP